MLVYILLILSASTGVSQNATELNQIYFSADVTSAFPGSGSDIYVRNSEIINFSTSSQTAVKSTDIGVIYQAGIDAFHNSGDGCGDSLYSLDTTATVAGVQMLASDVFTSAGIKVFDAQANGFPENVNIDSVSRDPQTCDLIFSIDSTTTLGGLQYKPDDLIRWSSVSGFSLFKELNLNINIDALHLLSSTRILLSSDTSTSISGVSLHDQDVIEIETCNGGEFQIIAFEPAQYNNSWEGADLKSLWVLPLLEGDLIFKNGFNVCD